MTQVQTMTKQQLNRKLAELMGYWVDSKKIGDGRVWYRLISPSGQPETTWRGTEEIPWLFAPYYCTDPAVSLEVQAKAITKDAIGYLSELSEVIEPDESRYQQDGELIAYSLEHTTRMLTASPRERAEAAYITLKST